MNKSVKEGAEKRCVDISLVCTRCINDIKRRTERQRGEEEHSEFNNSQDSAVWILAPDALLGAVDWPKAPWKNHSVTH
ncbi:unnamed protein product [Boreogadus saida]